MEKLIEWIIDNKAILLVVMITLSISIPVSIHFGKTIINNNIKKNQSIYNYKTSPQNKKSNYKNSKTQLSKNNHKVELTKISLYSTGKKGKVYTNQIYKSLNHNFGIEITLRNNSNCIQSVDIGWCIYKKGKTILKGNFNKNVKAQSSITSDFYIKEDAFKKLSIGKYKSQFWVNNVRVQKVFFTILNK